LLIFHPRDGGTLSGRITAKLLAPAGDWLSISSDRCRQSWLRKDCAS
jgi:hypothetical protein